MNESVSDHEASWLGITFRTEQGDILDEFPLEDLDISEESREVFRTVRAFYNAGNKGIGMDELREMYGGGESSSTPESSSSNTGDDKTSIDYNSGVGGGEPLKPSNPDFEFDGRTDVKEEIVFNQNMVSMVGDLRLELFPIDRHVSYQEVMEEILRIAHEEVFGPDSPADTKQKTTEGDEAA